MNNEYIISLLQVYCICEINKTEKLKKDLISINGGLTQEEALNIDKNINLFRKNIFHIHNLSYLIQNNHSPRTDIKYMEEFK